MYTSVPVSAAAPGIEVAPLIVIVPPVPKIEFPFKIIVPLPILVVFVDVLVSIVAVEAVDVPLMVRVTTVPLVDPPRPVADVSTPELTVAVPPLLALVFSVVVVTCAAPVWMVQRLALTSAIRAVAEYARFDIVSLSIINERWDRSEKSGFIKQLRRLTTQKVCFL